MKNIFLFLILLFIGANGYAQASKPDSTYYKNHFYINPFDLFFRTFTITCEREVNPNKNSIVINAGVLLEKRTDMSESGFNGEIQYRINIFDYKTSKRGLVSNIFFAPYVQFRYVDHKGTTQQLIQTFPAQSFVTESIDANLRGYGVGVVMGLKTTAFNNRFCFGFYGGGGLKYTDVKGAPNVFDTSIVGENFTGITPKFGLQMGMSF